MEATQFDTKTLRFLRKITKIVYLCGLPDFWIEDRKYPKLFIKLLAVISNVTFIITSTFVCLEWLSFFTQNHLTHKQKSDRMMLGLAHPILVVFELSLTRYKQELRTVLFHLAVGTKRVYNDHEIERQMIKKSKFFTTALCFIAFSSVFSYGFNSFLDTLQTGGPFMTAITAWPNTEDRSQEAGISRVILYIIWWLFLARTLAAYCTVIPIIICLEHQYRNLQSFFYKLDDIFRNQDVTQKQKEDEYESSVKVGIKLHIDTIWCSRQSQEACAGVFGGQIIINLLALVLLLSQMAHSERTLSNLITIGITIVALLASTGFIMWCAGDVTVEASYLATAMYHSGWQHCGRDSATRVRDLLVVAMSLAQKPVVMKSMGVTEMSYRSYLSIVKSSYSVFSVLY